MTAPTVEDQLRAGLAGSPLAEAADLVLQLTVFCNLVTEWNQAVNLTACRSSDEVARTLVLGALRPLMLGLQPPEPGPVFDVGSGGGNPGIPLALALPGRDVVLIEAHGRKVGFLRNAVGTLGLGNVRVEHARAEDLGRDPAWRETGALVTCRGVASPPRACELGLSLAKPGGAVWLYLSDTDAAAVQGQAGSLAAVGAGAVQVIGAGQEAGTICLLEKGGPARPDYPRPEHRSKRKPLF